MQKKIQDIDIEKINRKMKFGEVCGIIGESIRVKSLDVSMGDAVRIELQDREVRGIVSSISEEEFSVSLFSSTQGLSIGDKVFHLDGGIKVPVGEGIKGRVINALGTPIDGKGALEGVEDKVELTKEPVPALSREGITEVFETGVRSIDGLLTIGKGQKMGIFAGSGVGKSTLLSMIVRGSKAKIKIIAMVGERGREVPDFIDKGLNNDLTDTIIVAATSDESPIMRKYGILSALSIAEYYRDRGEDVLLIVDSITRVAMAQREIGLAAGELPVQKGYPPSVFSLLPQVLERVANINGGTMTAFFTVLVDGDNFNEPISDQVRGILDGHIILDRTLTERGIYPPVNVVKSASRVLTSIITKEEIANINKFRGLQSVLQENDVIINIGAYLQGSNPKLDEAIAKQEIMMEYIKQDENDTKDYYNSKKELEDITK